MMIRQWLKSLEARGDAWAKKRLTPEEFEEAVALDKELKRNFWRWLGAYLALTLSFGVLLWIVKPEKGLAESLILMQALGIGLLMIFSSAWFGYRRHARKGLWKQLAIVALLATAGAFVGGLGALAGKGELATAFADGQWGRSLAVGLLVGMVMACGLALIAWLRGRELRQQAARLQAEADSERFARQTAQAELKLLQAQIEPHFLFNTLANLRYLVSSGSRDALPMLDHLIHYLRTALPDLRSDGSTLGREAQLAGAYLAIMKLRMGEDFAFAIEVPEALAGVAFPSLMALTLVENAVKHGIGPGGAGGHIAMRAEAAGGRLRLSVEDNGRGLAEPIGQGVGLANIRERLAALYGAAARLELANRAPQGTVASIEIPFGSAVAESA
jgi:signal transduction histidine kinase